MSNISIIGAGGHSRSSIPLLRNHFPDAKYEIFDNSFVKNADEFIAGIRVTGNIKELNRDSLIFLSIGDNELRRKYFKQYKKNIIKKNIFHQSSIREAGVKFGEANQIFANCYINSFARIGNNNILNTASIIEHEAIIGNHNHISVGARLCGRVKVGDNCMVGAGVIIIDRISICDDVVIGAGSVVIRNISEGGTYVGSPARRIR